MVARTDGFVKFPRTPHLQGSRLGFGDDTTTVDPQLLAGRHLVVCEKLDGANTGLRVVDGTVQVQSRGHVLSGGPRERQFELLKAWVAARRDMFVDVLADRFLAFGEWCFAKHTVFYDELEHLWFNFDVFDVVDEVFLDVGSRRRLFDGTGVVLAPVLHEGTFARPDRLPELVGPSRYCSPLAPDRLCSAAASVGADPQRTLSESDVSGVAEGIYVKVEGGGRVLERYKWVRASFAQTIAASDSHWLDRPLIANRVVDPDVLW